MPDVRSPRPLAFAALLLAGVATAAAPPPSAGSLDLPEPVRAAGAARRASRDPRVRRYVLPARIVWKTPTADRAGGSVQNTGALLEKRTGQVTLGSHTPCALRTKDRPVGILLDFGIELHGGIQLMVWGTKGHQPVRLRVRFGESASEAMSDVHGPKNATNDHAVRDQTTLVPWLGTHEIGNTGFRFVRVDLVDKDSLVEFKSIRAIFVYRPLPYKGSFRSSDPRLDRIWKTGAYTVHLNMQEYLWDGIKRDRLVWVGDMHPETMTICAVFGANEVVPKSLDLIRDETPLPGWMNGISSYSMWWVLIHHGWYLRHGNREYLEKQRGYLKALLERLCTCMTPGGREKLPPSRFLDWPSSGNEKAIHAGLHALLVLTLEAGKDLCTVLGEEATAGKCSDAARRLKRHVPDPGGSKQAAALMALAGLEDPVKLNRDVLAVGGAAGLSTFYGYYVLEARALAGDYRGAMDAIRKYWGAMLKFGATTFWEDFDLEWTRNAARIDELVPEGKKDLHGDFGNYCYKGFRHSLCHGWASGPTAWLTEHVLGVRVLEPGCRVVQIDPHLGDLEWVEGTFPTPRGVIRLRHEKTKDGSIRSTIEPPAGVEIRRKR